MQSDQYLRNVEDVCEIFKCSQSTVWRWVANGTFPQPIKIGGTSRWTQAALTGVIVAAQKGQTTPRQEAKRNALRGTKFSRRKKTDAGGKPLSEKFSEKFSK